MEKSDFKCWQKRVWCDSKSQSVYWTIFIVKTNDIVQCHLIAKHFDIMYYTLVTWLVQGVFVIACGFKGKQSWDMFNIGYQHAHSMLVSTARRILNFPKRIELKLSCVIRIVNSSANGSCIRMKLNWCIRIQMYASCLSSFIKMLLECFPPFETRWNWIKWHKWMGLFALCVHI